MYYYVYISIYQLKKITRACCMLSTHDRRARLLTPTMPMGIDPEAMWSLFQCL